MQRRSFLKTTAGTGAVFLASALRASAAEARVKIHAARPGAKISPHIYGHFIEHLGGVIYDGVWVGTDSKIPNVRGIRKQFIDGLKAIRAPNLRWPGGCYADGYHWRDGIGPREKRPRTYNFWELRMPEGADATETNAFGTHEFLGLCREIGAEPYLAANLGTGTPREFGDWAMYCNAPSGTVSQAEERAANGHPEPFNVRYWGIGNESWACGGFLSAAEYAALYGRFAIAYPHGYNEPFFIAAGPNATQEDGHPNWGREFFEALGRKMARPPIHGWAMHFYTLFPQTGSHAVDITPEGWYEVLHRGNDLEGLIEEHWRILGGFDTKHETKLLVDEWGAWHPQGTEVRPEYLFSQAGSLRDALHAAMSLDIFNRHADKVHMCNLAQTVNCIHSLFLAEGGRFIRTPTYYVFDMYRPHMDTQLVPVEVEAPDITFARQGKDKKLFGLAGSASRKGRALTLTLVNPSLEADVDAEILLEGAEARSATGRVLTHEDRKALNTFDEPDNVQPKPVSLSASGGKFTINVPKMSVLAVEVELA